jgi:glycosyltransferase involved in cell wall biosynthesis
LNKVIKIDLIANFAAGKGHLLLLNALKEINKSKRLIEVKFFGEGGSEKLNREIRSFILANSLEGFVKFEGYIESKEDLFESIDAIVIPSISEGFGRVPFEAMQFGKPIIYSNSGALSEYMIPGKLGIAFESNNSKSLEHAIQSFLDMQTEQEYLVRNGYTFIEEISKMEPYILTFQRICEEVMLNQFENTHAHHMSRLIEEHSKLVTQYESVLSSRIWRYSKPLRHSVSKLREFLNLSERNLG